jgi:uncharacterized protein YjcR
MNAHSDLLKPDLILDNRIRAKFLYWLGWRISQIAPALGENEKTIHAWKKRDDWDSRAPNSRIEEALETRYIMLVMKDKKTSGERSEIKELGTELERQARIRRYNDGGNQADLNPNLKARNANPKKQPVKNPLTQEQIDTLIEAFQDDVFDYQKGWYRAGDERMRIILKSRQIGATFYFAREALIDALITGRNQIFLSASKAQAHVFKNYICSFVRQTIGVELRGDPIILPNEANLIFLGTNYRTAQSYHGNLYFDEFFWVHGFDKLHEVASGMSLHEKWRKTYFSTPSSTSHEAYKFWTGSVFNKGRPKDEHIKIDLSHDVLKHGRVGEDMNWRQIVTIMDAQEGGCDLFNIDRLKFEYSAEAFSNLLMCQFIDDGQSMFPLSMLQRCMVDSWEVWEDDFRAWTTRPFADKPVWIGYDPAETGDSAGLVVVAPPETPGGKFRVLEHHQFRGMDFAGQAAFIRELTFKYNVQYIGLDSTGMGTGVAQLVRQFFPTLVTFNYSPEVKTRLVLKTLDVIRNNRLEFDAGATDIASSLMSIKKALTASQTQFTFTASRSDEIGHADLAWALMHALHNEPLEGRTISNTGFLEIYG